MTKKTKSVNQNVKTEKELLIKSREEEAQLLIQLTEEKTNLKGTDKYLDRHLEKVELLNGTYIDPYDIYKTVSNIIRLYFPVFTQEFYIQIFRLNGWTIPEGKIHFKPPIVGRFTNEIIYCRFNAEVLNVLRKLNPYVAFGKRLHKHYHLLTPDAKIEIENFIKESTELMKKCTTWYEFRVRYAIQYKVTFQLSLFEKNTY